MTKAEKEFQEAVRALGCIVCLIEMHVDSICEIHHMLDGNRRIGEMFVLGLCPSHHRYGLNNAIAVSRHPNKAAFVRRYGAEAELLAKTRELINADSNEA